MSTTQPVPSPCPWSIPVQPPAPCVAHFPLASPSTRRAAVATVARQTPIASQSSSRMEVRSWMLLVMVDGDEGHPESPTPASWSSWRPPSPPLRKHALVWPASHLLARCRRQGLHRGLPGESTTNCMEHRVIWNAFGEKCAWFDWTTATIGFYSENQISFSFSRSAKRVDIIHEFTSTLMATWTKGFCSAWPSWYKILSPEYWKIHHLIS